MATKKDGVERLHQVPMFAGLSKRDVNRLWDHMKIVEHSAGHKIVVEGRGGHGFHLLLDGSVKVTRKGRQIRLGPGQFFGEMSLIDEGPRSATVTAETHVVTATMSSGEFRNFVKKRPDLLWKLLVVMTGRVREEQSVTANLTA
jgi:CRP-like cAMP-binding protein